MLYLHIYESANYSILIHTLYSIYFNQNQYFEGITANIWKYQIGGYQVCDKWLKDRKDRTLSLSDIKHYCKMATALKKTIEIQKEIDEIYQKVEEKIIELKMD